ncbi:MAG: rhomboid family intramembrane serine protease [Nibricoccus sp.]
MNDSFPDGSVDAGIYATYAEGFEHSLVVLAMGETCWLVSTDNGHHLRVEPSALDNVRRQLTHFDREQAGWPPRPFADDALRTRRMPFSPLLWVLGIFVGYWAQSERPGLTDAALLDARRVFDQGEWWRVWTALWLHADLGHLVSNAANGFMIFSVVIATFGFYAGWSLIGASAITGNVAAVALHAGDDYRSLGASTAVFAALGLLVGRAIRLAIRVGRLHRLRTLLTPLFAGLVILGLYGAGGVQVDVLAHALGFAAGILFGFCAVRTNVKTP